MMNGVYCISIGVQSGCRNKIAESKMLNKRSISFSASNEAWSLWKLCNGNGIES